MSESIRQFIACDVEIICGYSAVRYIKAPKDYNTLHRTVRLSAFVCQCATSNVITREDTRDEEIVTDKNEEVGENGE
jgi:hypothetical protein